MKRVTMLAIVATLFAWAAQAQGPETISLQFELLKNASVVAKPVLRVAAGTPGSLSLDNLKITVTPTRLAADRVEVVFEIATGADSIRPRLVLVKQEPGSVSWKSAGADAFELRVAVAP